MAATDTAGAVLAVADRHERTLATSLRSTLAGIQARFPASDIAELIDSHRGVSVEMIPWNDLFTMPTFKGAALAGDDLQGELLRTIVDAGKVGGVEGTSFTVLNPYAIRAARQMAADMIAAEKRIARDAVRRAIVTAMRGKLTGKEAAKLISQSIGLDARSAQALANYVTQLALVDAGQAGASTLTRAGMRTPLSAKARANAADRYAKRLLRTRAETIARTEIMSAANKGLTLSWEQAARDGLINVQHAQRSWVVSYDDRTCEQCVPLDGATVPFYGDFVSDMKGLTIDTMTASAKVTTHEPPLHPRCRCTMVLLG